MSRNRPKGKISDFLYMSANDISALTDSQLRGIVNKLNDAANKRMKRFEASGLGVLSPSYRARKAEGGSGRFALSGKEGRNQLKAAYIEARSFLAGKTSNAAGTLAYNKKFERAYEKVLGGKFDEVAYDKRYKNKKVLKKSTKKKLRDFWEKYEKWKEIQEKNDPDSAIGDTNINDVEIFEEEVYSKGRVNVADMEKKSKEDYLKKEKEARKAAGEYDETDDVQDGAPNGSRPRKAKSNKPKKSRNGIRIRFEKISIFD